MDPLTTEVGLLARLLGHCVLVDRRPAQLCSAGTHDRIALEAARDRIAREAEPAQGVLEQPSIPANSKIPTIVYFIVRCRGVLDKP